MTDQIQWDALADTMFRRNVDLESSNYAMHFVEILKEKEDLVDDFDHSIVVDFTKHFLTNRISHHVEDNDGLVAYGLIQSFRSELGQSELNQLSDIINEAKKSRGELFIVDISLGEMKKDIYKLLNFDNQILDSLKQKELYFSASKAESDLGNKIIEIECRVITDELKKNSIWKNSETHLDDFGRNTVYVKK